MNKIRVWPHLTIIALLFVALGVVAAALWYRNEPTAEAAVLPNAARVERVDGEVGLNRGLEGTDDQWIEVTPNTPISAGDRIYARDNARASIAFTGRNFAMIEPDSSFDVLSLSDESTQIALRDGSSIFNIGELDSGELFEVATPRGAFQLQQPGIYEVGNNADGSSWISVLSGLAQVAGLAGSGQVSKGEMLTLLGQTAADVVLSRIQPEYAGGLLDDYYGYQYPDNYDGRYRDYNSYLNDPYYYDPSNRFASYQHVNDRIPGVWALDNYGDWQDVSGLGSAWRPRVDAGWSPYQQGSWTMDNPHGLTWVSNEPWGYAPYHYGRWANADGQWYWVPESQNTQPVYSPALVAFVPLTESNEIGWVPLGPGDPYVPTYYDSNWQPHYQRPVQSLDRIANLNVPGAVTIVPVDAFGRVIDAKAFAKAQRKGFDGVRPVLDPLSVAFMRQAALQTNNKHRRVGIPPGLAKRLDSTYVYTSAKPFAPPFREDPSKLLRVHQVPDKEKNQKLKWKDERGATHFPERADTGNVDKAREHKMEKLEKDSAGGNKEARREVRDIRRQERTEQRTNRKHNESPVAVAQPVAQPVKEKNGPGHEQKAQGERVGMKEKPAKVDSGHGPKPGKGKKN